MKRRQSMLLLILLTGMIVGCGLFQGKGAAEGTANSFYDSVKRKDFDKALTFYSPKFFEKTARAQWMGSLKEINEKLGDLEEYKLTSSELKKNMTVAGSGTYYVLQYKVTYSKYKAEESLTLFKPSTGGEFKILGHGINSEGLEKESESVGDQVGSQRACLSL